MGAGDYRLAPRSGVRLAGDPVNTPWDPELRDVMRVEGHAVCEETIGDHLLADLATCRCRIQKPDGLPFAGQCRTRLARAANPSSKATTASPVGWSSDAATTARRPERGFTG
jgi:hypothetical protein